ncbi:ATP-grasp domain-containing protein [Aneurinibacillus thermoaerophilus]|uniref:Ribosomal protein S6--L-glutamate ligase n=1 Tax=Aneurinibacillus thermoaerophilus TaxID=143495 RepID=A0A1G8F332_ANETH|nr:RimK family alpha-L-glutamate ligase [Aneurinibacillus thermoaerophilus]MED0738637.1 RimK family alpha-L-glutamate ligase [Aneurinibacillus thermoaerophilus]SDH76524.1 ribosomal protein S6--L-glutamate ligase [Aneurinibacillus thermoaerophilus]
MAVLILCREETSDVIELNRELKKRGYEVIVSTPQDILVRSCGGENQFLYRNEPLRISCVLGWVSLQQREYGMWLLKAFEIAGIPVINDTDVLTIGQNKFLNSILLNHHNIPHIPTFLVGNMDQLDEVINQLHFPLVLKPIIGAKGQMVIRVDDENALRNIAPFYMQGNKPLYVQAHINKPGRDIRVRVIDYKAEYAFYRYSDKGTFLTNLSVGGNWEECPLESDLSELAEKCSRVFNASVAGVDIVEDEQGNYLVIEVNTTPAITYPRDETVLLVANLIERVLQKNVTSSDST